MSKTEEIFFVEAEGYKGIRECVLYHRSRKNFLLSIPRDKRSAKMRREFRKVNSFIRKFFLWAVMRIRFLCRGGTRVPRVREFIWLEPEYEASLLKDLLLPYKLLIRVTVRRNSADM